MMPDRERYGERQNGSYGVSERSDQPGGEGKVAEAGGPVKGWTFGGWLMGNAYTTTPTARIVAVASTTNFRSIMQV
jgi:hypothetical protein